jgi:hypothetical protein
MPDVAISLDSDDFESIMTKTLSDPGVIGTIENGLAYRFGIIQEVSPNAVLRAKAVNIRDYTSLVLLEEDRIKLYYSIRVLQDFLAQQRIAEKDTLDWPAEIQSLVRLTKQELQATYFAAKYDIVRQFMESDYRFNEFVRCIKKYTQERKPVILQEFFESYPNISSETLDRWRLLLKRISRGWYEIYTLSAKELGAVEEIEYILSERLIAKKMHDGLAFP